MSLQYGYDTVSTSSKRPGTVSSTPQVQAKVRRKNIQSNSLSMTLDANFQSITVWSSSCFLLILSVINLSSDNTLRKSPLVGVYSERHGDGGVILVCNSTNQVKVRKNIVRVWLRIVPPEALYKIYAAEGGEIPYTIEQSNTLNFHLLCRLLNVLLCWMVY